MVVAASILSVHGLADVDSNEAVLTIQIVVIGAGCFISALLRDLRRKDQRYTVVGIAPMGFAFGQALIGKRLHACKLTARIEHPSMKIRPSSGVWFPDLETVS